MYATQARLQIQKRHACFVNLKFKASKTLPMTVCVCVVYVCVCVPIQVCVWLHLCAGTEACVWRPDIDIKCILLSPSTVILEIESLTDPWSSPIWQNKLDSGIPRSTCLSLSRARITSMCYYAPILTYVLRIKFGSSCLCDKHFTCWAISTASMILKKKKQKTSYSSTNTYICSDWKFFQVWAVANLASLEAISLGPQQPPVRWEPHSDWLTVSMLLF